MKIVVSGCCGEIAPYLIDELLSLGHDVIGIDGLFRGKKENVAHLRDNKKFKLVTRDINTLNSADKIIFENCDAIFHLAANSDIQASAKNPSIDFDNTFMTTKVLLDIAVEYNINQFCFASTSAIFGETTHPITENYGPLKPISHYGAAKLASEAFISSYAHQFDIKSWIIRFPNCVGFNKMTHGAIFDFITRLKKDNSILKVLGNGTQEKPYIHISELVKAIIFIWLNSACRVNVYNVAPDSATTVANIAKWCAAEFNCENIEFGKENIGWKGDVQKFRYDCSKLSKFGFDLKMTSDEAVKRAIKELK